MKYVTTSTFIKTPKYESTSTIIKTSIRYNCTIICDLLFLRLFKRFFKIRVRGGFRVRVRVGDSFRVRVRDRVSFRARGWVGRFYILRPEAIRIKFALAEDSECKTKSCRESFIFSVNSAASNSIRINLWRMSLGSRNRSFQITVNKNIQLVFKSNDKSFFYFLICCFIFLNRSTPNWRNKCGRSTTAQN